MAPEDWICFFPTGSLRQVAHGLFQAIDRNAVHMLVHDVLDDGDRLPVLPIPLRFRIKPGGPGPVFQQTLQPGCAGFGIVVFDRSTGLQDLRSDESRVGKAWVSTFSFRWSQ